MAGRWDAVTVEGGTMRCYVSSPEGAGPFSGVIVAQHAGGVDEFIQTMSDRIAAAGYVAIAPDLYHRDPIPEDNPLVRMGRLRDANIVADVNAAFEHAKGLEEVAGERIGTVGFCMGGRVAYLMATHIPALRAAVVFYGGNVMVSWGEGPAPFDGTEHIKCPVLGLFGEEDTNPSPADVVKIGAELTRLDKAHEFHSYAGVGHAFMNEERPGYRKDTAEEAWAKCLGWLERYLS